MQPVKEYTFDNFIVGRSNQFAFTAAKAVAEKPGQVYNPLYIYGERGLGKTHLLNAIYNQIRKSSLDAVVFMLTADQLTMEIIKTYKAQQPTEWYEKIRSADVLLIDDVHLLQGKMGTQAEFVSILRSFVQEKRQVVLTSSVEPETLPVLESSLRSDYEWCLLADIQPLDTETGKLVARDKAAHCGLQLSEEALDYISSHANREVRRLEGVINRLHAEKELLVSDIDLDAVKQTCEDYDRAFSQDTDRKAKTAFIMIGIQGSGKSEFCRRYLPGIERINLDTLKTRRNERRAITACHVRGVDYVVDNTNPAREDRARYIPEAKAMGYRVIGYFMQSRLQECIARNNQREGKERIPAKAIAMTSNRLEMPSFDEGFDELYFVANDGSEMIISEWRENDDL